MIYKREEYIEEGEQGAKFPVKHIEVLTPVDGGKPEFVGQLAIGLQTPMGVQQIPVSFGIYAADITEAFTRFDAQAEPKIEETRKSIQEEMGRLRREAGSRIVTPGELGMGGVGGAPRPGGGNIIDLKP